MPEAEPIQLSMGNRRQSIMLMDDNSDVFMSQRSGFEGNLDRGHVAIVWIFLIQTSVQWCFASPLM